MTAPARRPVDDAIDRLGEAVEVWVRDVETRNEALDAAATVRSELERLREAREAAEAEKRRLTEGLREISRIAVNGDDHAIPDTLARVDAIESVAHALLSASPSDGEPCPFCGFQGPFDGHVCEPVLCGCGDPENCRYATAEEHADSPPDGGGA